MAFQFDFLGGTVPQNTRFLKCPKCMNALRWQNKLIIIPPDPPPLYNTRPENYTIDETQYLITQDGKTLDTQGGLDLTPNVPNPNEVGYTASMLSAVDATNPPHPINLANLYLDIFTTIPNPATSVLATITGSATRPNIASQVTEQLTPASVQFLTNTDTITISASAVGSTNFSYVGIYDAATNGNLLGYGQASYRGPPGAIIGQHIGGFTTTVGMAVVFKSFDLVILESAIPNGAMVTESGALVMVTENGIIMVVGP